MSNLRRIRDLPLKGTPELDDALEISADPSGSFHIITSSLSALFQLISEKGAANGYAGLDASTKLLVSNLPDTVVQTDQANTYSAAVVQNFGTSEIVNVGGMAIGATTPGAFDLFVENSVTARFRMIGSAGNVTQSMGAEFDWIYRRTTGNAIMDIVAIPEDGAGNATYRFGLNTGSTGRSTILLIEPPGTAQQTSLSSSGGNTFLNAIGGNVGIGDTTPSFKLDVAGDIRTTSDFVITNSNSYFIKASAITANRNATLPLLTANDIFVFEAFAQTLTNKTITAAANSLSIASTDLTDSSSIARNSNNLSFFSSTTSAQLLGVMSDETGSGLLVFGTSPVIVTPTIVSFTNAPHNHQTAAGGEQLLSTSALSDTANIAYLNTANTYTAGFKQSFVASSGTAGININNETPSTTVGGDIWRATDALTYRNNADTADIVIATTSGTLAQFAATTSAELAGVITNETGSGSLVFATSPSLVTPALGTPTGVNLSNATELPVSGLADGTDGQLITWDDSGAVAVVSTGDADQILTSNGTGQAPTFQDAVGAEFVGPWTEDHDAGTNNLKRLAAILDASDNEIMTFTNSVTPANFVTVASSDTGVAPTWSVDGSDDNIDLDIAAKNTGVVNMVSPLSLENNPISNVENPTFDQDATTKKFVDSGNGFESKIPIRAASTGDVDIDVEFQNNFEMDTVTLVTNDRVMLKDQTLPQENGVYLVPSTATATPTRVTDMDVTGEFIGASFFINDGSTNVGKTFVQIENVTTVDTDPVTFNLVGVPANVKCGDGTVIVNSSTSVTFNTSFASSPNVTVSFAGNTDYTNGSKGVALSVHSISTSGFIVRFDDDGGGASSPASFQWIATNAGNPS